MLWRVDYVCRELTFVVQDKHQESEEEDEQEEDSRSAKRQRVNVKPDPFFKAKRVAEVKREEKNRVVKETQVKKKQQEKKINQRKKRHMKLSLRTKTGQPVVRNRIKDILAKLQSETQ